MPRVGLLDGVVAKLIKMDANLAEVLLVGSTAYLSSYEGWDDFDLQAYSRTQPATDSYYEILAQGSKRYLVSVYFSKLDAELRPDRPVPLQRDVRVLFGSSETLKHIPVSRPRRIEPLGTRLGNFGIRHETFFNILVDILFILNRCEARGRANATKARVAREGLRTICTYFDAFYGIERNLPKRTRWRTQMLCAGGLLASKEYWKLCLNGPFVKEALELILSSTKPADAPV